MTRDSVSAVVAGMVLWAEEANGVGGDAEDGVWKHSFVGPLR